MAAKQPPHSRSTRQLGQLVREEFLRLPAPTRAAILATFGKRAPWDPRFDHLSPPSAVGLGVGPPDVVGIGVQKAGTTWWQALLATHPGFYAHPGVHKERHFFARFYSAEMTDADVAVYHRWFPRPEGCLTGEWTPDYLHQDWVPAALQRAAPAAKLIVILRDPVERYRSGLGHHVAHSGGVTPTLAADAFARGFYSEPLARYEALFPTDSLLVLQYEACRDDPAGELARTLRFVGLDDTWRPPQLAVAVNRASPTTTVELPARRRRELAEHYAADMAAVAAAYPTVDLDRWPAARLVGLASSGP
jgi:hypothetical protein